MPGKEKPYIFYLQNTVTGACYYRDAGGNVQSQSIMAAGTSQDVSLKNAPDGWLTSTLTYRRNSTYYGFNRSYSDPLKMVKDAAYIVRNKFYLGHGVESKFTLLILKFNPNPLPGEPTYKLYHKAPLDLPQKLDKLAESFSCSLLEGGVLQMLKTYEKTIFQIPCDGSIPENIKVNMDGMYVEDTLNYQIIPSVMPHPNADLRNPNVVTSVFVSNEGDNIGVVHQDTELSTMTHYNDLNNFVTSSPNYLFSSSRAISVRIKGQLNVVPVNGPTTFQLSYYTSLSHVIAGYKATRASSMLTQTVKDNTDVTTSDDDYVVVVPSIQTLYFDKTINLAAGENLFLMAGTSSQASLPSILGGNFTITFSSIAATSAPWCITAYDLFKLIIKAINQVASTQFNPVNFGADSQLLLQKLNLVCTSGDAIRASADPTYQKYYNALQTNPLFPNVNNSYSFGPVIKTSLYDFFTSFNAILNGSLGSQTLPSEGESVFFESKSYVYDNTKTTFDLGEVSDFETTVDIEKMFTILKIGYANQNYDQKAGKYEWNTTLEMVSPLNAIETKTLEIISKYRTDPHGIEKLRANIDQTSDSRNAADNSVFVINTDQSNFIYDYFETVFTSSIQAPTTNPNTNIALIPNYGNQSIPMVSSRAGYFSVNNDPSILLLSQAGLSSSWPLTISIAGSLNGSPANLLTGAPADYITINVFVNGAIVKTYTTTASSASTAIAVSDTLTRTWNTNDCIYVQASTSATGTASISSITLALNTTYFTANGSNIPVEAGASNKMIALPLIAAPTIGSLPVLSYGFQYFQFNSVLSNKNFETRFTFSGQQNGGPSDSVAVRIVVNGVQQGSVSATGTGGGWTPFGGTFDFFNDWNVGDIMFTTITLGNLNAQITGADLKVTSTQIKAYALKRVQYDFLSGIPNLCGYVTTPITFTILGFTYTINIPTAIPVTTGAGAPYNIEELTPKRMLMTWGNYLRSILFDQIPGQLKFSTLSKNQYLVTTKDGVNVTENANVNIGDLAEPLFSTHLAQFSTRVPATFQDMMRSTANAFLSWTYNGQKYYGFPNEMKQKSALNEMQTWEVQIA